MPSYEWPSLPVLDVDEAAEILAERLQAAYDDLEAERLRVLADPRMLRKPLVDAWIREFTTAINAFETRADAEVRQFLELHLNHRYVEGVERVTGAGSMLWTQPHRIALTSLATDTYEDFLQRSREAGRVSDAMVRAVRRAAGEEIPKAAAGAKTAKQAGKLFADSLRDKYGIDHVIYRDGAQVAVRTYAEMAARTKSAVAYNAGTLNQCHAVGVKYVEVFDGGACGWTRHDDPDLANASIRTVEEAASFPISHPRCIRDFGPRPDVTSPAEAESAPLSTTAEQRADQESVDYGLAGRRQ